ncbi:ABC transporter ATP-binding protein [Iamia sp. SCSIO 61187]|uniref:ABC transporter ATP-binding protein n=1 Tax=Iamia sp. SCSIO 61187 TaxID=2722752 RepID=UPI001C629642|nr:ABC transporter ATP-binding protein [Iamia sp. SCSIO 61187]QYG94493.1 ABC transporter ATP-binding protein [Iamia sp. SCSIO 61187]
MTAPASESTAGAPLLAVRDVTVRFGGLVANDGVSLAVAAGHVAALVGPNGAGKTTLFNVIAGTVRPTSGQVLLDGTDLTALGTRRRARLGLGRTFQNLSLVADLSALDNVAVGLGRFRCTGLPGALLQTRRARREDREIRELARAALGFVGLAGVAHRPAGELPYGDRRRVELARALALGPRLMLLDEPSAGMGAGETATLADIVRRACSELGVTVLLVEHDMSVVRSLAQETTVLDLGRVLTSGPTDAVLADPQVAAAYLGAGTLA